MPETPIQEREVRTLRQFYELMAATRDVRAVAVQDIVDGGRASPEAVQQLKNALASLQGIPFEDAEHGSGPRVLALDHGRSIPVDLEYETSELRKDILYLEQGEAALLDHLASLHPGFREAVDRGVAALGGKHFNCFVTDRDGTTNNYCGRYRSSVQSAYNAVFLTLFARARTRNPIFLTSAPLQGGGIVDVSANPTRSFIYAASKGREFLDLEGARRHFPIDPGKQALLDRLNGELEQLTAQADYGKFTLIGSGLQFKFGQTTVARQDIGKSVPEEESSAFLKRIGELVQALDPQMEKFRIEDTGLDVEIILTIEGEGGLKDFDKGDGVAWLDRAMGLGLEDGPHLVCGDTSSDVPMVEAARARSDDTWSVFVTRKEELARRVRFVCPNAVIVPEPDMLVTILRQLA